MNEALQLFKNKQFGEIRVIDEDCKPLFCGKDIATALGYENATKAVRDHCRTDGGLKRYPIVDTLGRIQEAVFISEGDVYRLIAHSKLPAAQEFESLIFDTILPAIRKNGYYGMITLNDALKVLNEKHIGIEEYYELKTGTPYSIMIANKVKQGTNAELMFKYRYSIADVAEYCNISCGKVSRIAFECKIGRDKYLAKEVFNVLRFTDSGKRKVYSHLGNVCQS